MSPLNIFFLGILVGVVLGVIITVVYAICANSAHISEKEGTR